MPRAPQSGSHLADAPAQLGDATSLRQGVGRADHHLRRDAPPVRALPAHQGGLDPEHPQTALGQRPGDVLTARSHPDHCDVVGLHQFSFFSGEAQLGRGLERWGVPGVPGIPAGPVRSPTAGVCPGHPGAAHQPRRAPRIPAGRDGLPGRRAGAWPRGPGDASARPRCTASTRPGGRGPPRRRPRRARRRRRPRPSPAVDGAGEDSPAGNPPAPAGDSVDRMDPGESGRFSLR